VKVHGPKTTNTEGESAELQRKRVLRALWRVARDVSPSVASTIEEAAKATKTQRHMLLTKVERIPGLDSKFWELVVRAKAVMSGRPDSTFWDAYWKYEGLI